MKLKVSSVGSVLSGLVVLVLLLGTVPTPSVAAAADDVPGGMTFTLDAGPYTITKDEDGLDVIRMQGFSSTMSSGDPMLAHRVYNIAVPPDIIWSSLKLDIVSAETTVLEGIYDIKPVPPHAPIGDDAQIREWGRGKDIVNGRNMKVYGTDADFPETYLELHPYSQMRKWKFTRVDFTPFQYNPVSQQLALIRSVTIQISYEQSGVRLSASLMNDTVMDDVARQILFNYPQAEGMYQAEPVARAGGATYDYVIITTSAIQTNSTKLSDFIAHKESLGHSVLVVTEGTWDVPGGQAPDHRAERIRQWLMDHYVTYAIEWVLLIGNPCPYETHPSYGGEGDVPMKMCWPRKECGNDQEAPTDYFYADLTGNWDIDGDEYYGEHQACADGDYDYPVPGGVDSAAEVYVGRIPVYDAAYGTLDSILQKTIDYETEPDIAWRKSALLPMSFSDSGTDGAYLAEHMKADYLDAAGFSSWSMYQDGTADGDCSDTDFVLGVDFQEELRGGTVVRHRWAADHYGIVCWWAHGDAGKAYVGYPGCSDGTLFRSSYCDQLDDDHPAFTYQCSCTNGKPSSSGNLQYAILKQGGIGTVGATRMSWYLIGGAGCTGAGADASNSCIGYHYVKRLVSDCPAGQALYLATQSADSGDECNTDLANLYMFNLYGDPSISLASGGGTSPLVSNLEGASDVTSGSARLNGMVISTGGEAPTVSVHWGDDDGGQTGPWDNSVSLGIRPAGAFYLDMSGLSASSEYFYRCSATNSGGTNWANSTSTFTTSTSEELTWTSMTSGTSEDLRGVWGSSGNDVFAVGEGGTIRHYNGSTWGGPDSSTTDNLHAVWGNTSNKVIAVGNSGTIIQRPYDPPFDPWIGRILPEPGGTPNLDGVWVSASSHFFAVGADNALHYDGGGGSWMTMPPGESPCLQGVWGSAWNDVFAVGAGMSGGSEHEGTILHYDGNDVAGGTWTQMWFSSDSAFYGVGGSSGDDVFAVGLSSTILHYHDGSWGAMTAPPGMTEHLYGVWANAAYDVYAVGPEGTIIYYDGSGWGTLTVPPDVADKDLYGVWGSGSGDVFAVGEDGTVLHGVATTPPTATTGGSEDVGATSVTLNGTLTDDGSDVCEYRFEYDVDSLEPYASQTAWMSGKTTGQSFSVDIAHLDPATQYYFRAQVKNNGGMGSGSEQSFTTKAEAGTDEIGVWYPTNFTFYLDYDGSGTWNAGDKAFKWGDSGCTPLVGNWNGGAEDKIGVWHPSTFTFYLDYDGSGTWNAGDKAYPWGNSACTPLVGDWNNDGKDKIGVWYPNNFRYYLDYDGSGTWNAGDKSFKWGNSSCTPVVGNWNGGAGDKIGVWRPSNFRFYLDYDGSGTWNAGDKSFKWGDSSCTPVVGNWD